MDAAYIIRLDEGWIEQTFSGRITLPELFAFVASAHADPQWHPDLLGLSDFRAASLAFTFHEMMEVVLTESSGERWSRQPWAYVLPRTDQAMLGTLRMYQNLVADTRAPIGLFFEPEDAREWLREKRPAP